MAGTVEVAMRVVGDAAVVQTGAGCIAGAVTYFLMLLVLRVDDVATLRQRILRR
jgi:hypothetical protein